MTLTPTDLKKDYFVKIQVDVETWYMSETFVFSVDLMYVQPEVDHPSYASEL